MRWSPLHLAARRNNVHVVHILIDSNADLDCLDVVMINVFMARRAIPMIAFHSVESIYIYILCPLARLCVVYVVKEVASFPGARSINGRGA